MNKALQEGRSYFTKGFIFLVTILILTSCGNSDDYSGTGATSGTGGTSHSSGGNGLLWYMLGRASSSNNSYSAPVSNFNSTSESSVSKGTSSTKSSSIGGSRSSGFGG